MTDKFDAYRANRAFGFGRDNLMNAIVRSAIDQRCVLYFGGRQSGKTTLLLRVVDNLGRHISAHKMDTFVCPVYVDLSSLPFDADPGVFYAHLCASAVRQCNFWIDGFEINNDEEFSKLQSINDFAENIQKIVASAGEIDLTILFLLDEAERVVGERFPRGFHDNLFSLLYGPELAGKTKIGIVFAGAQGLYKFAEDKTSPIGSRAKFLYNENLGSDDLNLYLDWISQHYGISVPSAIRPIVFSMTGGHPGIANRLSSFIAATDIKTIEQMEHKSDQFLGECQQLLRVWASSLSPKARAVHDKLANQEIVSQQDVSKIFVGHGWDPILSDRAVEELVFTGIARCESQNVVRANEVYWRYIAPFIPSEIVEVAVLPPPTVDELQAAVWALIKKLEITLRSFVGQIYTDVYGANVENEVGSVFGPVAMAKVRANVIKSNARYKFTPRQKAITLFEGMYLGQLAQLMISKKSWPHFSHMFQDKRELELMMAPITAVRTDEAHFYATPERELLRCKLHCEDMLSIVERNLPSQAV
ncbi:AAA family ATPase [Telluria sp. Tellsp104]